MEIEKTKVNKPMSGASLKGLTRKQQLAFDLTVNQPAAKIKYHSLEDLAFPTDLQMTDEEFKEFMDAILEARRLSKEPPDLGSDGGDSNS